MRKFLLSALLLLCVRFYQSVSSDALVVTQSSDVSFQEGEAGNISCCWKEKYEIVGFQWLKHQMMIKNDTVINQSTGSQSEQRKNCSFLTFPKIRSRDSGRYICRVNVEIPVLAEVEGNGTTITVNPDNTTSLMDVHRDDFCIFGLRCLPILVLINAFLWIYCFGTKTQRDREVSAASKNETASSQSGEEHHKINQEINQEERMEEEERTTEAAGENEEMMGIFYPAFSL